MTLVDALQVGFQRFCWTSELLHLRVQNFSTLYLHGQNNTCKVLLVMKLVCNQDFTTYSAPGYTSIRITNESLAL